MSHFSVLVIGKNPEKQLAPYSESIKVKKYKVDVVSEEEKERFINHYTKDNKNKELPFKQIYKKYGDDWNSNAWEKDADGDWIEYSTYNPKSKWDWYELGGRFTGFFKLKNGANGKAGKPGLMTEYAKSGYTDQALKKDIDFEFMKNEAAIKAEKDYDFAMTILGKLPINETWETVRNRRDDKDIDKARDEYGKQPRCKAWEEAQKKAGNDWPFGWFSSTDEFVINKEEYIENAKIESVVPFAILKNGKWYEKGEMGWWGIVINGKEGELWNNEVYKLLESVSDDTLLSLYDCHI